MGKFAGVVFAGLMLAGVLLPAQAQQSQSQNQGIYSCVDSKGRKLTADRPIVDCVDREQKVLNPSGTVKATIGPALTAQERAELEARQKREEMERARQAEEKRRERALLVRYPNRAVHDVERAEALAQIGVVRRAALNRVAELAKERGRLMTEMEFYAKDPERAPLSLKREIDENTRSTEVQQRFIADQDTEIARVNARFDEELGRLKQLWAQQASGVISAPARK